MLASHSPPGIESTKTSDEPIASTLRKKSARQVLSDRATRGLSLMPGFKSRQSSFKGQMDATTRAGLSNVGTSQPLPQSSNNSGSEAGEVGEGEGGAVGRGDASVGSSAGVQLTKLVLKFTTASEADVQPSREISTDGASIGQSELNTVSIPSDGMLAPLNHAFVRYDGAAAAAAVRRSDSTATIPAGDNGDDVAATQCGEATSRRAGPALSGGGAGGGGVAGRTGVCGFFFADGGQETDFAAAVRIRVGEGNRDWPLVQGCHFSAGLTVFEAHRVPPARNRTGNATEGESAVDSCSKRVDDGDVVTSISDDGCGSVPSDAASTGAGGVSDDGGKGKSDGDSMGDAAAGPTAPCLWLEALAGCSKGQVWKVGPEGGTLGRASDNNVSLADKEMSRRHSKLEYDASRDEFYLCDLGSLNGTYMQMVGPYAPQRRLGLGDHLLVGRTGFSVNRYDYGISERMGARPSMEDRSTVIQDLGLVSLGGSLLWPQTFAGVYDGHGGGQASEYLWANLHIKVTDSLMARSERLLTAANIAERAGAFANRSNCSKGQGLLARAAGLRLNPFGAADGGGSGVGEIAGAWDAVDAVVKEALKEAFAAADEEFIKTSRLPEAGSTATTCLILGPRLYVANVGDSRTLLCRNGKLRMASQDHKPSRKDEQARVHRAGGFVAHRRVMGELAVSRAFGDSEFKGKPANPDSTSGAEGRNDSSETGEMVMQLIISEPEFLVSEITVQDQFAVLACDGVFDVFTSEEVIGNVIEKMKVHGDAQRCCEDLTERAIVERRTRDNVSLVMLVFNKWY